jgi:tetratricopeptide (TPR) repeat protein
MVLRRQRSTHAHRRVTTLLLVAFFLICSLLAAAQRRSFGGSAQIQVRIAYENHRPAGPTLRVQLTTGIGTLVAESATDTSGQARFYNVNPGTYRIKVSGVGIEDTETDIFEILETDPVSFQHIEVMRTKDARSGQTPAAGPPVSARALRVPQKARDRFLKGMDLLKEGKKEEGMKALASATEAYAHYAEAFDWMGVASLPGDLPAAKGYFQQAIDADDHYAPTYTHLARVLMEEKAYAESEGVIRKGLAIDPTSGENLFLLSYLQLLQDRPADSVQSANKAHSVAHGKFAIVHIVAGEAYLRLKDNAKAREQFNLYLQEAPNGDQAEQARAALKSLDAAQ